MQLLASHRIPRQEAKMKRLIAKLQERTYLRHWKGTSQVLEITTYLGYSCQGAFQRDQPRVYPPIHRLHHPRRW